MRNILQVFTDIAQNEGITITNLEKKIGASKGVLSRAISKGTDIQAKWLIALVDNYPLYSAEWILTGTGPMLQRDSAESISKETDPDVLREKLVNLQNQLDALEKANNALEDANESLKETKLILQKRISELETNSKR
jgi:exonuclease VII small subunit